jgi:chromosome segregation ATPase
MPELEKRIGLLRILLVDIASKQEQLAEMERQYRMQLTRVVDFVVYREGDVSNALSLMSEIQQKLDEVLQTRVHLETLESKSQTELEVLVLTKRVAEARSQLALLQERQQELSTRLAHLSGASENEEEMTSEPAAEVEEIRAIYVEVEGEIARLHSLITDASERAAKTVQPKAKEGS